MIYDKKITYVENLINEVLIGVGEVSLFNNETFEIINSKIHDKSYVVLELVKPNTIELIFWFECGDLRIDIDRTSETYTYDIEFIKENEEYIKNIITMIFTCSIKVEYCGENYTKLYFINKEGKTLNTFSFTTGLLGFFGLISKKNCKEKLYPPIYPSEKICLTEPVIPNK